MPNENNNIENAYIKRVPPHDNDAEQAVLSCMLFDEEGVRTGVESLHEEDFYVPAHAEIFNAMYHIYANEHGKPLDIVTLKNRLDEVGMTEKVGGMPYLIQLADLASTSANTKTYADIVAEKAVLRRLIKAAKSIEETSFGAVENVDNVIAEAEEMVHKIGENRKAKDFEPIEDVLVKSLENIEAAGRNNSSITGIATGFADFDRKTAGLQNTDLIIIAARPAMGKTAFALNVAQYAATRGNVPTAIFSLEMSSEQLVKRMISSEALVDAGKLKIGQLSGEEWSEVAKAAGVLSAAPVYIDDTPGITPMELRAKCRKLKLEHGLGLIVIDYLQLMDGGRGRKNDSQQNEVAYISNSLKAIAKELEVPVIALSQLSRANTKRKGGDMRPMLSDLRDSGAIEQDADMVCFLHREEYYNPDTEKKNQAELIVAKHRNGSVGTVDLMWLGQYTKFANLERTVDNGEIPFDV